MATTNSLNNRSNTFTINNYSLPSTDGSAGQIIQTNGAGALSFTDHALTGSVIQTVESDVTTVVEVDAAIPFDDSIPQNTEGVEVNTVSITPISASNQLRVTFLVAGNAETSSSNLTLTLACFQDSTANAIFVTYAHSSASSPTLMSGTFFVTAGTTSSTTIKLRMGLENTTSFYVNGNGGGTRVFGGLSKAILSVQEIKV